MNLLKSATLIPLTWASRFYAHNILLILGICIIASFGRALQFRIIGDLSPFSYWFVEVIVELSRVVIVLLISGFGNIHRGVRSIISIFSKRRADWKRIATKMKLNLRMKWKNVLFNLLVFSLIAYVYTSLLKESAVCIVWADIFKDLNPLQSGSATTQFIFFVKNLTIIPFTLIFEFALVFYLIDRIDHKSNTI